MAIPVIYKGDDTDFRGSTGFTLKVVTSSNLNLSGCAVEVEVLGFRRSFPASATGELVCPFAFTAAETQRMPLGIHAATVRVYDSKGRVRTINNSIRVKVTNSVHEAYGKDDPQEVTLAVSTVDLEAYAKKAEVTAAITAALKDASASVKLHALAPEVTDTTVTLKPQDGAANWVDGKVEVAEVRRWERVYESSAFGSAEFRDVDGGYHGVLIHTNTDTYEFISVEDQYDVAFLTVKMPSTCSVFDSMTGETIGTIPAGTVFSIECDGGIPSADETPDLRLSVKFYYSSMFEFVEWQGRYADMQPLLMGAYGYVDLLSCVSTPARSPVVALPESTNSAKSRRFSLAIETDAEPEKAVEWQGGEVIEAVPGASKLVPGLNVWDVAEVAPGKFRVERASSPAQSAPLTLTAPNGRVAELTVGDDLVIEVKEK